MAQEIIVGNQAAIPEWQKLNPLYWENNKIKWSLSTYDSTIFLIKFHLWEKSYNYFIEKT